MTDSTPATATTATIRRAWLRAAILFAATLAGGLILATGVAPRLEGFDRWVVLAVGSGLFTAGTAFFLGVGFLLDLRDA